ncbi:outer membrane protein assembly factor BamC [mine drainage metagenome]|uniref:Outer membrane protein assembly factor BamC n=1 Tax=mine drainage metagenome TaxID=410659 RepID=A0A1J5Q8S7_9ZZZZ
MKIYLSTLLLSALLLAGCSGTLLQSKTIDYQSASKQQLPSLEVPPDLTTPKRDDRYAVPEISANKGSATYSAYTGDQGAQAAAPASSEVLPHVPNMHIERDGSERWLVVSGMTPDALWPIIKSFWQEHGFIINVDRPEAGIMETDWAENRANLPQDIIRRTLGKVFDSLYSTAQRDKFRTRLERGTVPGTTDIFISHRGMDEVYIDEGKSQTRWQPRAPDPGLEAEMLRLLMVRLGAGEAQAKALVAAPQTVAHAQLVQAGAGAGSLRVAEPFDRAWRRVGLALDRVGFTVEDRDRSKGLYFVRYLDPEVQAKQGKGFLDKLMFWKSGKSDITDKEQYRIYVKGETDSSTVQVLSSKGDVAQTETAKKILQLLFEQLQ